LEQAMEAAGLDGEVLYAVRYECLQSLRTDLHGDGANIAGRLREVA